MFENKRRQATEAIVSALKPVIGVSAMTGGLPDDYWEDPYVLGFLHGCIHTIGDKAGIKPGSPDLPLIWLDAYDQLSDRQGKIVIERIRALNRVRDKDLVLAMGNGALCASYALGLEDFPDDPNVRKAQRIGSDYTIALGHTDRKNPERTRTAGALVHILFHDIIRERLQT